MKETSPILKGKYAFKKGDNPYTYEAFTLVQYDENNHYLFTAETLSRTQDGQLLKIKTTTETTSDLAPYIIKVERSMGERKSFEHWDLTSTDRQIRFEFKNKDVHKETEFYPPNRFQIASPSFVTSLLMTETSTNSNYQRTPFSILKTNNFWDFANFPFEEPIFVEKHSIKKTSEDLLPHQAPHYFKVFTGESSDDEQDEFALYFPTVHYSIPLKGDFGDDIRVELTEFVPPRKGPTYKDIFDD